MVTLRYGRHAKQTNLLHGEEWSMLKKLEVLYTRAYITLYWIWVICYHSVTESAFSSKPPMSNLKTRHKRKPKQVGIPQVEEIWSSMQKQTKLN